MDWLDDEDETLEVTSDAFEHGDSIPAEHTCDGRDVSPPLSFGDVPEEAETLALVMDDPDAPMGEFTHWTWWNVPAQQGGLPEDASLPGVGGAEGVNDFGNPGYGGPCPPTGTHRYFLYVVAVDTELDLDEGAGTDDLVKRLKDHVVAWGSLMGRYHRG